MVVNLADLSKSGFRTESDVEQKLILPLLTATEWLAIPITDIQTKQYLPPTQIDKGAGRRIGYYPDYSIWINAVPIMIVEAKSPIESADEGFREAQLYAHELNKVFPTGINPVQFVLCVNGKTLRYGHWDSAKIADVAVAELKLGTAAHHSMRSFIGYDALKREAATIKQKFRPTQTYRPINYSGGEQALNRRIELNSFSIDIAPLVRMFFEPDSAERTEDIIRKAYVSSEEVTKYDQTLEAFLRDNVRSVQDRRPKRLQRGKTKKHFLRQKSAHSRGDCLLLDKYSFSSDQLGQENLYFASGTTISSVQPI